MPQPRKYKTNAERQAAYRLRKSAAAAARIAAAEQEPPNQALVKRVMAADARASSPAS